MSELRSCPTEWSALTDEALSAVRDQYEGLSLAEPVGRARQHYTGVARAASLELRRRALVMAEPWQDDASAFAYDYAGPFGVATVTRHDDTRWSVTWSVLANGVWSERVAWFGAQEAADESCKRWVRDGREPSKAPTLIGLPACQVPHLPTAEHMIAVEELRAAEQGREWWA